MSEIRVHKCLLKRSGASRPVIRRVDANATGRLAPFRYFFNGLITGERLAAGRKRLDSFSTGFAGEKVAAGRKRGTSQPPRTKSAWRFRRLAVIIGGCLFLAASVDAYAQQQIRIQAAQLQFGFGPVQPQENLNDIDKATIKTDADLEDSMNKAKRYLADGNYRIACRIWQEVLNRCGDTLYSTDGEIYYSLGREVERLIAQLPPEGLQTYRISADAAATEIMAATGEKKRSVALSQITNQLFLSSVGDDAAYELACQSLDAYDFIGAIRLLKRIAEDYPNPSVPLDQVWLRIALCYAFNGDRDGATAALEHAAQYPPTDKPLANQVASAVSDLRDTTQTNGMGNWTERGKVWPRLIAMPGVAQRVDERRSMARFSIPYRTHPSDSGSDRR